VIGDQRCKLEQRLDVAVLCAPCAGRPQPLVHHGGQPVRQVGEQLESGKAGSSKNHPNEG